METEKTCLPVPYVVVKSMIKCPGKGSYYQAMQATYLCIASTIYQASIKKIDRTRHGGAYL